MINGKLKIPSWELIIRMLSKLNMKIIDLAPTVCGRIMFLLYSMCVHNIYAPNMWENHLAHESENLGDFSL
jgi:hypothetical protein